MKPRFNFFDDSSGEILRHATEIKIHLIKSPEGLGIEFQILGGFMPGEHGDEVGTVPVAREAPEADAAELAGKLLAQFVAKGGEA